MNWKPEATIGELYHPAMKLQTEQEAAAYLNALIDWTMRYHGQTPEQARSIQLQHLGYFAGYYDSETMARVNRIFNTVHPIFGKTRTGIKAAISQPEVPADAQ